MSCQAVRTGRTRKQYIRAESVFCYSFSLFINFLFIESYIYLEAGFGVEPNSTLAQCTQRVCSPRGARLPKPAARLFYASHYIPRFTSTVKLIIFIFSSRDIEITNLHLLPFPNKLQVKENLSTGGYYALQKRNRNTGKRNR